MGRNRSVDLQHGNMSVPVIRVPVQEVNLRACITHCCQRVELVQEVAEVNGAMKQRMAELRESMVRKSESMMEMLTDSHGQTEGETGAMQGT